MLRFIKATVYMTILLIGAACSRNVDRMLVDAAAENNIASIKALLEQGANVDARANDDWTP